MFITRRTAILGVEQDGNECRLPVIAVHDIDVQFQQPNGLQDRSTEKDESFAIVAIIGPTFPVEFGTIIVFPLLDEIDRDAIAVAFVDQTQDSALNTLIADRNFQGDSAVLQVITASMHLAIRGKYQSHRVPETM